MYSINICHTFEYENVIIKLFEISISKFIKCKTNLKMNNYNIVSEMDMHAIKEYIGTKHISLKNIAKKFGIKKRVLFRCLSMDSEVSNVSNPLLHGSYKAESRCWVNNNC